MSQPAVLLIDDDVLQLDMLRMWLTHDGFDVTTAEGGAAAIAVLEARGFDAIVTDLRMPGVTGLDVVEAAHARYPAMPVIILTGQGSVAEALEALREGQAVEFLQKPLRDLQLLSRALRKAMPGDKRPS